MYMSPRESEPRTAQLPDVQPENTALDASLRHENLKISTSRALIAPLLAWAAISINTPAAILQADVAHNKAIAASASPDIDPIHSNAPEFLTDAKDSTFYLAGFDTENGDIYGKYTHVGLSQFIPGNAESIDYGKAPLNFNQLAETIISHAREQRLDHVSLAGNSAGGIVALEVALRIIETSDLEVRHVHMNSTPSGDEGLRPESRQQMTTLLDFLYMVNDSEYSTAARVALSTLMENERWADGDIAALIQTIEEAWHLAKDGKRPPMWTVADQAWVIMQAHLSDTIAKIASHAPDKRMPTLGYAHPTDPKADVVVDVETSANAICRTAHEHGLSCFVATVDDAVHTSYLFDSQNIAEGLARITPDLRAAIAAEDTRYALIRHDEFAADALLAHLTRN